jgi:hypothetical protein
VRYESKKTRKSASAVEKTARSREQAQARREGAEEQEVGIKRKPEAHSALLHNGPPVCSYETFLLLIRQPHHSQM